MRLNDYQSKDRAKNYNDLRFSGNLKLINQDEQNLLKKWLAYINIKNPTCIDLGTGTGRVLKTIISISPKKAYALDSSDFMLSVLKNNFPKEIKSKKIITISSTADVTKLSKNSINIVTAFHLFKHIDGLSPIFDELKKVTTSHGYLIFDVLNINSIVRLNLETCFALDKKNIEKQLKKHGFAIEKYYYMHHFGETIYNYIPFVHYLDLILSKFNLGTGTKLFILAKKI